MRVLVAPDKFKGSMSAASAAQAIARGFSSAWPQTILDLAPIADGGEGFAECLQTGFGGEWVELVVSDALGRPVPARYLWIPARKTAVIEMSQASGLWRLRPDERAPLQAATFGTGQLMRHAVEHGAQTLVLGLGGSATTDGGIGMAAALGFTFLSSNGQVLQPVPANLRLIERIDTHAALELPMVIAACDVQNPLLGPEGTVAVFSSQKGADAQTQEQLEDGLQNLVRIVARDLRTDFSSQPCAGAAGGLGYGVRTFCNATIRSGFEIVAEALDLEDRIAACDLILTGEGRLDGQTLHGKGPAALAGLARKFGKPLVAFAGSVSNDPGVCELFTVSIPIVDEPMSLQEAMNRGGELLERAAIRAAKLIELGTLL